MTSPTTFISSLASRVGLVLGVVVLIATTLTTTAGAQQATPTTAVPQDELPDLLAGWSQAWNDADAEGLGSLYTPDGRYTDHAFDATFTGPEGVAQWSGITSQVIEDIEVTIHDVWHLQDTYIVRWTFAGTISGAPTPFAVPALSVHKQQGELLVSTDDYYDRALLLRQSGLPEDTDLSG